MRLLTADEIQQLYAQHVKVNDTRAYSQRYNRLPLLENRRAWRWEGKDLARVLAVLEFGRYCVQYGLSARHLLTFNGASDPELEYLPFEAHSNFDYSDDPTRFDLHQLKIPEAPYDFAMVNQTLEHVYNPSVCLENIRQYLAPGAYIYANAPSINIAHSTPFHFYTGFTPTGFACLFRGAGFEVLEVGQWGNRAYLNRLFRTQAWPDFHQLRSYTGDFDTPVIVWVLARKD
jgi:hypothetical protein